MSHQHWFVSCTVAALLFAAANTAYTHHSLAAEFDVDKMLEISGTITAMAWTNPHAWLHVNVQGADGNVENWAVEFASPNSLYRRGWSKADLPTGAPVTIVGYAPRDNSNTISATEVTLSDGRRLFAGTRQEE